MTEEIKSKLGFSLVHVGLNSENEEQALHTAGLFAAIFGFGYTVGNSSIFSAERTIEIMKKPFLGTHGHLAVATRDIEFAQAYLQEHGYSFLEETRVVKNGKTVAIYLKDEIAGFAVHLLQQ